MYNEEKIDECIKNIEELKKAYEYQEEKDTRMFRNMMELDKKLDKIDEDISKLNDSINKISIENNNIPSSMLKEIINMLYYSNRNLGNNPSILNSVDLKPSDFVKDPKSILSVDLESSDFVQDPEKPNNIIRKERD